MASSSLRIIGKKDFLEARSREMIITTAGNSRLLSFLSDQINPRGLIILLHGWEGSSSSTYIISTGYFFYQAGFSICRLNLRDHGDSHHLNEDLFHGALLEETFDAINLVSNLYTDLPVYVIGFSLGANFALRVGKKNSRQPIKGLKHIFAVSPPLDPYKATLSIDNNFLFYRKYFLRKWKRSLMKKQKAFPHKYDFSKFLHAQSCLELTEAIMPYFPDFPSYRDYFNLYTLKDDFFNDLNLPVTIFIAEDDPVIPVDDFHKLRPHELLQISRQKYGGHCGFLDLFPPGCWLQKTIVSIIS